MSPHSIVDLDVASTFLVDPPASPKPRIRQGDHVRVCAPRAFVRAGYRKTAANFADEALDLYRGLRRTHPEVVRLMQSRDLIQALARGLAHRAGLGGPERGVWVRPIPEAEVGRVGVVIGAPQQVRVGRYYPPSGSGEDYEDGGLAGARTVTVWTVRLDEDGARQMLAGDLARVGGRRG